jgi:hypothetical protein
MEKQTAVMKLLQYILVDCRNKDGVIQFSAHETFNEYLEMEKQQIIDAVKYGYNGHKIGHYTPNFREQQELFEQYYKKTYVE